MLKHLHKIPEYNLYKLIIYEGTDDEYFCFTTPEAAAAIDNYLQYRQRHGEKLTPDSYLFREQFNTEDPPFDRKNIVWDWTKTKQGRISFFENQSINHQNERNHSE
jgi:hypothetical protein